MSDALQRLGLDAVMAGALLTFAMAMAALMLLGLDAAKGALGVVVSAGADKLTSHKFTSLEGLRGLLALAVVSHHACCWYYYTQFGVWTTGSSVVFDRLADFGVTQFFYLSGFLFWRKLMKTGRIPRGRFYLSRFVRIGPVYYVCVGAAILTGFAAVGFHLLVTTEDLMASLAPWILFSQGMPTEVNHADIVRITSGVTWTLGLEWMFYLSLPFLGWFARTWRRLLVYALVFGVVFAAGRYLRSGADTGGVHVAGAVLAVYAKFMLIGFGGGALVAALEENLRRRWKPKAGLGSWVVVAFYAAYLAVPGIRAAGQVLLLAAFALVVLGTDIFGVLSSRPMRLLGVISYPIYLLHGMVYFWAMRLRGGIHPVSLHAYLAETSVCVGVVLLLALAVHLLVERPTMRMSERMARVAAVPQNLTR